MASLAAPRPIMPTMTSPALPLATPACSATGIAADDGRYRTLQARNARFNGRFFTGVTSTGLYCRPVCAVRTPRCENCRFFTEGDGLHVPGAFDGQDLRK